MQTNAQGPDAGPRLLAVATPQDIEFLVKESEVLTGLPGRTFVIAGADWLTYRVQWHTMGFKVERLDECHLSAYSGHFDFGVIRPVPGPCRGCQFRHIPASLISAYSGHLPVSCP